MVFDMVTTVGCWDWDRFNDHLPVTVLEHMAAIPPPMAHLGNDVHHLKNVERVRRHIAVLDECSICHDMPDDTDHVLQFCAKARELWGVILDVDHMEHEGVLERGNRLIAECENVFSQTRANPKVAPRSGRLWEEFFGDDNPCYATTRLAGTVAVILAEEHCSLEEMLITAESVTQRRSRNDPGG
ncbi:hypothetical protein V6N11_068188 [Hibiscus sabdariffa]|uniref:Reverse transcriptase zinc-binding domain-containing protein n=1 Tax=Hibiscus sabdariffa TaxID=183260 RepID=A0ABR2SSY1_9ROSI